MSKYSKKFVENLKDYFTRQFKHDKNYPIKETHKVIDVYFRSANIMSVVRRVQEQMEDPNFKYKKFSDLFNEYSRYETTMKYLCKKSLIDENGKWKSTDKNLVEIIKIVHQKGRFKKDISLSTMFIIYISKKFFLTTVNPNTVKRTPDRKSGDRFDNL